MAWSWCVLYHESGVLIFHVEAIIQWEWYARQYSRKCQGDNYSKCYRRDTVPSMNLMMLYNNLNLAKYSYLAMYIKHSYTYINRIYQI